MSIVSCVTLPDFHKTCLPQRVESVLAFLSNGRNYLLVALPLPFLPILQRRYNANMAVSGKKRKSKDGLQGTHSSKRLRLADDLPWRRAAEPVTADFDEDGIVFELEEIEGVAVEYVESKETGKKIAKFTMIEGDGSDSERTNAGQVLSEEEWIPAESDDDDNSRRDFPTQNALPVPKPDGISIGVFDDSPIDGELTICCAFLY